LPSRHAASSSLSTRAITILVATLTALALAVPAATAETRVNRVAGETRVDTSVQVARAGWDQADHVLLATAVDYPDAIAAASLASALDAPVLLTMPDELSSGAAAVIRDLGASEVTLLGGTKALSGAVARQARDLGVQVSRIAGATRFDTAALIAQRVAELTDVSEVAVALGTRADGRDAWPDALSAASLAGGDAVVPTLLTERYSLPGETREALQALDADHAMILGGPTAVGDEVTEAVAEHVREVSRLRGPDRYDTAISVARVAMQSAEADRAVFVSGEDFADALSGGALAARFDAPLLLVPAGLLDDEVDAFLRRDASTFQRGMLIGGNNAVTEHVETELRAAMNGEPRPAPPPPPCPANSSPDCQYTYRHPISTWERLAQCESGGNWAINTGNGYYGGIQFSLGSWQAVGGSGYPHQNTKWEQIHRGEKLQARQGWGAWPACSRKLGLR
jgi:putative cell wall-binding protein